MLVQFQTRAWDLFVVSLYAIVVTIVILAFGGMVTGILLMLFAPGYVLTAVLFPGNKGLDWIERVALSVGLSIVLVPLLGLGLNFTTFGITPLSLIGTVSSFTVVVGLAAYLRRMQRPPLERLSASVNLVWPTWNDHSVLDRAITVLLVAGIVVAVATVVLILAMPHPNTSLTQFYILGPGGNASGYPTSLARSLPGAIVIGIANHESAVVDYTIRIDLVGVRIVHNATSGIDDLVEVNRTTWSTINVTVADGQNWTQPYSFQINYTGLWKVQFLLFRDGDSSSAYRELHLFIRVL